MDRIARFIAPVLVVLTVLIPKPAVSGDQAFRGFYVSDIFGDARLAALANAACNGDVDQVAVAVRSGVEPDRAGALGFTALGWAANCDNTAGIEALLNAGADPNKIMGDLFTPTYFAVTKRPVTLALLLERGGNPNTIDDGTSMLQQAFLVGEAGRGWENYYLLLRSGADVNQVTETGATIAIDAVIAGRFDKVEELLGLGYTHDLSKLPLEIQKPYGPVTPDQEIHRQKILKNLRDLGVSIPTPRPS